MAHDNDNTTPDLKLGFIVVAIILIVIAVLAGSGSLGAVGVILLWLAV